MSYILGFMFADGNITKTKRNTNFLAIYTADHDLLLSITQAIGSEHKISKRTSIIGQVFRIQIGSTELFDDLVKLGLTPNKTKRMNLPEIPKKYVGSFIRGYFDGDGNVWTGLMHKKRLKKTNVIQVCFTSCSHDFLNSLFVLLVSFGVSGGSLFRSKKGNYSRLLFSTLDSLIIYKIMYNGSHKLFLKRKKLVFDRFIKMRP